MFWLWARSEALPCWAQRTCWGGRKALKLPPTAVSFPSDDAKNVLMLTQHACFQLPCMSARARKLPELVVEVLGHLWQCSICLFWAATHVGLVCQEVSGVWLSFFLSWDGSTEFIWNLRLNLSNSSLMLKEGYPLLPTAVAVSFAKSRMWQCSFSTLLPFMLALPICEDSSALMSVFGSKAGVEGRPLIATHTFCSLLRYCEYSSPWCIVMTTSIFSHSPWTLHLMSIILFCDHLYVLDSTALRGNCDAKIIGQLSNCFS